MVFILNGWSKNEKIMYYWFNYWLVSSIWMLNSLFSKMSLCFITNGKTFIRKPCCVELADRREWQWVIDCIDFRWALLIGYGMIDILNMDFHYLPITTTIFIKVLNISFQMPTILSTFKLMYFFYFGFELLDIFGFDCCFYGSFLEVLL